MTSILLCFFNFLNIQALLLDTIPIQINYWYYTLIFVLKKLRKNCPAFDVK